MRSDDLRDLNESIFEYVGLSGYETEVSMLQACAGRLVPGAKDLSDILSDSAARITVSAFQNPQATVAINSEYLMYARLVSIDICNGNFGGIIELGIDLEQAQILSKLTNRQIRYLAKRWPGEIFRVELPKLPAAAIHAKALPHYYVALATSLGMGEGIK